MASEADTLPRHFPDPRCFGMLAIFGIILAFLTGLGVAYWLVVWFHIAMLALNPPRVRDGINMSEPEGGWPRLSIVIPAHNEQDVIDACIDSIRQQNYPDLEIIVVLDRCTDATKQILQRHADEDGRVQIVENDSCPDGWAGKCNAARLGADRASGSYILFTDADTWFDPDLCRASVAWTAQHELSLLSLLSTLTYHQLFEQTAQPVATMNLMRMFPIHRVNRDDRPRDFANGQFLLFDRAFYDSIGGHETVRGDLLEDVAFSRLVSRQGGRTRVALADGMLKCSMYETLDEFKEGWKRIYLEVCRRKPDRLRQNGMRVFLNGVVLPALQLLALVVVAALFLHGSPALAIVLASIILAGFAAQYSVLAVIYRISGAPVSAIWLYPLGCFIVSRVFLAAASDLVHRRPIRWGGREYVFEPR